MGGFLTFLVIMVAVVWFFAYLRKREQAAFRDGGDLTVLKDMDLPAPAKAHVANVVALPAAAQAVIAEGPDVTLRDAALDDVHRGFLAVLEAVLGDRFRVFVNIPLTDFLRGDPTVAGKTLSFLVCERADFAVVLGIALKGAGPTEQARHGYLERVFAAIDKPLASFPMVGNISEEEIREAIEPLLGR